jgi:stage III sporulation protein AG
MRTDRRVEIAVYGGIAVLVIALYLLGTDLESGTKGQAQASSTIQVTSAAEADIEQRLKEVLSCIRGAGKVEVMITYDTSREIVPAMTTSVNSTGSETSDGGKNSSSQQSTQSTEPATVTGSDGNSPIVLKEIEPIVRGVIVVAEGAADVSVRMDLQRAVRAVLDIPLSQIEVFERSAQPTK